MIVGILLLAPLAVSVLAAGAGPRLPVAIRIALRDLVRYRARSGAALAATTFAVFLAMAICLVASIEFENPLNWFGSNLSSSQLIVYTQQQSGGPARDAAHRRPAGQPRRAGGQLSRLACTPSPRCRWSVRRRAVPGGHAGAARPFTGSVYVATPQLLAMYGIKASQIARAPTS